MNIYDEEIETLKEVMYDLTRDENDNKGLTIYQIVDKLLSTKKALERAKKVEELLGLYRQKDVYGKTILPYKEYLKICDEIKLKEKELEEMK